MINTKRYRRMVSLLMVLVFVLMTLFTGCGSQPAGQAETGINIAAESISADDDSQALRTEDAVESEDTSDPAQSQDAAADEPDEQISESTDSDAEPAVIDADGIYTSKEDVALYIYTYHELPSNFITKKEAKKLGWTGGSLEPYAEGKCIGGDRFGNYEGILPEGETYYECDINTLGASKRGSKRIIFTTDGTVYYTEDHYESFEQLY